MRVMVLVKGDAKPGEPQGPSAEMLAEMGKFNEELVNAGVMLSGEGLLPSVKGKRVKFSGSSRTVVDGPFAESKELVAGFWIWQVRSLDEAVDWAKRIPNPDNIDSEVEIRQVAEAEDFGEAYTPEVREQEERLRTRLGQQQR